MRRWAAALLVSSLVPLSACASSKQAQPSARIIVSATEQADTARFETTFHTEGESDGGAVLTGALDFAHHLGYSVERVPSDRGPGDKPVETRWIGSVSYSQTGENDGPIAVARRAKWISTDAAQVADAQPCKSLRTHVASLSVFPAANPVSSIETLRDAGYSLVRAGTDTVRGVKATHWRVRIPPRPTVTTTSSCKQATLRKVTIDVWSDEQHRLRRVRLYSVVPPLRIAGHTIPTTTQITTTDVYDYGVAVHVAAPPADEVYDDTKSMVEIARGHGALVGSWRDVAHGTVNGNPWTVWFATTSTGWRCPDAIDVPKDTSVSGEQVTESFDGIATPPPIRHDGHVVQCEPPDVPFSALFTVLAQVHDGATTTLVGMFDGSITAARLHFADGTATPFPFDHDTGIGSWTGSAMPVTVEADGTTCSLQLVGMSSNNMCMGAFG